jgi:O-antigen/teichoic acid export membrane protein
MTVQARDRISQLCRRSLRVSLFLAVPAFAGLAILAPLLLRLWLGDRFIETLPATFRIMLIGAFVSIAGVPASCALMGMGHVRHNLGAQVAGAGANLAAILCVFAVLRMSIAAVAWSSVVGMTAGTLYLVFQNKRILKGVPASWRTSTEISHLSSCSTDLSRVPGTVMDR